MKNPKLIKEHLLEGIDILYGVENDAILDSFHLPYQCFNDNMMALFYAYDHGVYMESV